MNLRSLLIVDVGLRGLQEGLDLCLEFAHLEYAVDPVFSHLIDLQGFVHLDGYHKAGVRECHVEVAPIG